MYVEEIGFLSWTIPAFWGGDKGECVETTLGCSIEFLNVLGLLVIGG
jgi:hypothetical protein